MFEHSFAAHRTPRGCSTRLGALAFALVIVASCHKDSTGPTYPAGFLGGTSSDHEIGAVVNATGNSVTLFQVGSPTTQQQISLGTSSTITAVGLSIGGTHAAVPLGDAASVALIDLTTASITRFFTFASGKHHRLGILE